MSYKIGVDVLKAGHKVTSSKKPKYTVYSGTNFLDLDTLSHNEFDEIVSRLNRMKVVQAVLLRKFGEAGKKYVDIEEIAEEAAKVSGGVGWKKGDAKYWITSVFPKQELVIVQKDKVVPTDKLISSEFKVPVVKEYDFTFVGTSSLKSKVSSAPKTDYEIKKKAIEDTLAINDVILFKGSIIQIAGTAYSLLTDLSSSEQKEFKKKLDDIVLKEKFGEEDVVNLNLVLADIQDKTGKSIVTEFSVPAKLYNDVFVLAEQMKDAGVTAGSVDSKTQVEFSKLKTKLSPSSLVKDLAIVSEEQMQIFNTDFLGFQMKEGGKGGIINIIHQNTINKQKQLLQESGQFMKLSQRVAIESPLVEEKRIKAFADEWTKIKAERIIDGTTGSSNAGAFFTLKEKKINGQIQIGAVGGHSLVLWDDGKIISLQYNETGPTHRAELMNDTLNRVGFHSVLSGKTVKAHVKSRPEIYRMIAHITPNFVDLDLVHHYVNNKVIREAMIKAIILGYPVSHHDVRDKTMSTEKKQLGLYKLASKTIGTSEFQQAILEYTGKKLTKEEKLAMKKQQEMQLKAKEEKIKIAQSFKPGEYVKILGGQQGTPGELAVIDHVDVSDENQPLVYVKSLEKEATYDKLIQNIEKVTLSPSELKKAKIKKNIPEEVTKFVEKKKKEIGGYKPVEIKTEIKSLKDLQPDDIIKFPEEATVLPQFKNVPLKVTKIDETSKRLWVKFVDEEKNKQTMGYSEPYGWHTEPEHFMEGNIVKLTEGPAKGSEFKILGVSGSLVEAQLLSKGGNELKVFYVLNQDFLDLVTSKDKNSVVLKGIKYKVGDTVKLTQNTTEMWENVPVKIVGVSSSQIQVQSPSKENNFFFGKSDIEKYDIKKLESKDIGTEEILPGDYVTYIGQITSYKHLKNKKLLVLDVEHDKQTGNPVLIVGNPEGGKEAIFPSEVKKVDEEFGKFKIGDTIKLTKGDNEKWVGVPLEINDIDYSSEGIEYMLTNPSGDSVSFSEDFLIEEGGPIKVGPLAKEDKSKLYEKTIMKPLTSTSKIIVYTLDTEEAIKIPFWMGNAHFKELLQTGAKYIGKSLVLIQTPEAANYLTHYAEEHKKPFIFQLKGHEKV